MADEEHLTLLKQGVEAWNAWRARHPSVRPDLRGADLSELDLTGANLQQTDLRSARLTHTTLWGAHLWGAHLWGAHFEQADLTEARELVEEQFAGTNLSRAYLPPVFSTFPRVAGIEVIFNTVQQLFLSLLVACIYAWLTIAATTDAQLLSRSVSSPLPIIGTTIPLTGFYFVMPLLLFCLYVYLHLSLQQLWELLGTLPTVFPDGKRRDQKCPPPLLSALVQSQCHPLSTGCAAGVRVQTVAAIFLLWGIVPVTLFGFWWWYLSQDDWLVALLAGLFVMSVAVGVWFYHRTATMLQGPEVKPSPSMRAASVAGVVLLAIFCYAKTTGVLDDERCFLASSTPLSYLGCRHAAHIDQADVSTKPPNWTGRTESGEPEELKKVVALVKGASLRGANLQYARGVEAFLAKADLSCANLQQANLQQADLRKANLQRAGLQRALLPWADLRLADLRQADLQDAHLEGAVMDGASLSIFSDCWLGCFEPVNLSNAYLVTAHLRGADLKGANLTGAYLQDAYLNGAQLQGARLEDAHLEQADLSDAKLSRLKLPSRARCQDDSYARCQDDSYECPIRPGRLIVDLEDPSSPDRKATLLPGADLQGAYLKGAKLKNADLQGADLRRAYGLPASQVKVARHWDLAFYSDDLLQKLELPPNHNARLPDKFLEIE